MAAGLSDFVSAFKINPFHLEDEHSPYNEESNACAVWEDLEVDDFM